VTDENEENIVFVNAKDSVYEGNNSSLTIFSDFLHNNKSYNTMSANNLENQFRDGYRLSDKVKIYCLFVFYFCDFK